MIDGSIPDNGQTIQVDHSVVEFKIVIRHLGSATNSSIKELLQRKFEVLEVSQVDSTAYCTSGSLDLF